MRTRIGLNINKDHYLELHEIWSKIKLPGLKNHLGDPLNGSLDVRRRIMNMIQPIENIRTGVRTNIQDQTSIIDEGRTNPKDLRDGVRMALVGQILKNRKDIPLNPVVIPGIEVWEGGRRENFGESSVLDDLG
jgi:hypothetical protein